jgi:IS1 family transposase
LQYQVKTLVSIFLSLFFERKTNTKVYLTQEYDSAAARRGRHGLCRVDKALRNISTSYIERQNLTMRKNMRRFARLTNGFSKKLDNHMHQVALFHMHYNFGRVHQTLKATPAMAAGLSYHVWSIQEIVTLANQALAMAA